MNDDCRECREGKHRNCTGWAINPDDEIVPCDCEAGGHL